jgi:hypothetical protein
MVSPFFQTQIDQLTEKLNSFDHTSSDGAVILPNHTFASYKDVRKFIEEEQVISVGGFLDLFSALVVMTPKQQSGKSRLTSNTLQVELKLQHSKTIWLLP